MSQKILFTALTFGLISGTTWYINSAVTTFSTFVQSCQGQASNFTSNVKDTVSSLASSGPIELAKQSFGFNSDPNQLTLHITQDPVVAQSHVWSWWGTVHFPIMLGICGCIIGSYLTYKVFVPRIEERERQRILHDKRLVLGACNEVEKGIKSKESHTRVLREAIKTMNATILGTNAANKELSQLTAKVKDLGQEATVRTLADRKTELKESYKNFAVDLSNTVIISVASQLKQVTGAHQSVMAERLLNLTHDRFNKVIERQVRADPEKINKGVHKERHKLSPKSHCQIPGNMGSSRWSHFSNLSVTTLTLTTALIGLAAFSTDYIAAGQGLDLGQAISTHLKNGCKKIIYPELMLREVYPSSWWLMHQGLYNETSSLSNFMEEWRLSRTTDTIPTIKATILGGNADELKILQAQFSNEVDTLNQILTPNEVPVAPNHQIIQLFN